MRHRALLQALAGAACAVLLATAGSAVAAAAPAPDPIAGMAKAVARAGTYRMRMTITTRAAGVPKPVVVRIEGAFSSKPTVMRMDFDMSSAVVAGGGKAADGKYVAIVAATPGKAVMYMRGGPFKQLLGKGKSWVLVDTAAIKSASGVDLAKQLTSGNDPSTQVEALRKAGAVVEEVGKETLGGVATTRWKLTVPIAKALLAQGSSAEAVKKLIALLPAGTDTLTYDLWLDGNEFPRRFLFTLPVLSGADAIEQEMDMRLFSPGAIVRTALPPGRLVDDITQKLLSSMNG